MIPQISQAPGVVQLVLNFLQVLEQQGFTGDTATSYADRLTMATDNSVYINCCRMRFYSPLHGRRRSAGKTGCGRTF